MSDLIELNKEYIDIINENLSEEKEASKEVLEYLDNSTAKYHGSSIYILYMPKIFTEKTENIFKQGVDVMYSIFSKVINHYLENKEYRKYFGFDEKLEELILVPRGYDCPLPIARIDIFLNEEDMTYKFCEFNTDGSSSMNEDREINNALKKSRVYNEFSQNHNVKTYELFDSWAREFLSIYNTYDKKIDNPQIAIVDFTDKASSIEEFEEFRQAFIRAGVEARICDITKLTYSEGVLYGEDGYRIDAIYRRAVTSDIMKNYNKVLPFINAFKDRNVCLLGAFCTQVVHNKILFKLLFENETQQLLNEEEKEYVKKHIPFTSKLNEESINKYEVITDKDKWIIKPEDSYGAKGVYAGIHFDNELWGDLVHKYMQRDYLIQEFNYPYRTVNMDFKKNPIEVLEYSNLTGLYMYGGKFTGVYSRQSSKEIISTAYDENSVATIIVK